MPLIQRPPRGDVRQLADEAAEIAALLRGVPARVQALGIGVARLRLTRQEQGLDVRRYEALIGEARALAEEAWPLYLAIVHLAAAAEKLGGGPTAAERLAERLGGKRTASLVRPAAPSGRHLGPRIGRRGEGR